MTYYKYERFLESEPIFRTINGKEYSLIRLLFGSFEVEEYYTKYGCLKACRMVPYSGGDRDPARWFRPEDWKSFWLPFFAGWEFPKDEDE